MDIDICGPSVPKMFGVEGEEVHQSNMGWSPVYVDDNLGVMSIGFMLPDPNEAVVWRGPRKTALIKQFVKDVDWGELDFLVVGLTVCRYLPFVDVWSSRSSDKLHVYCAIPDRCSPRDI